jgi:hypothetical protein
MAGNDDPFDTFSKETLRRADEMCAKLSLDLRIDRRGRSRLYNGAVSDLDDPKGKHQSLTVAAVGDQPWFTLISDSPLQPCRHALLVFRKSPTDDVKYVGRLSESEPGKRGGEDANRFVTRFDILRDDHRR